LQQQSNTPTLLKTGTGNPTKTLDKSVKQPKAKKTQTQKSQFPFKNIQILILTQRKKPSSIQSCVSLTIKFKGKCLF